MRRIAALAYGVFVCQVLACGSGNATAPRDGGTNDGAAPPRSADPDWLVWGANGDIGVVDLAYDDPAATLRKVSGGLAGGCDAPARGAFLAPNRQRVAASRDGHLIFLDLAGAALSGPDLGSPMPFGSPYGIGCHRWAASSQRVVVTFESTYGSTSFLGADGTVGPKIPLVTDPIPSPRDDVFAVCGSGAQVVALWDTRDGASAKPREIAGGASECVWSPTGDALATTNFVLPVADGKPGAPSATGEIAQRLSWLADGSHVIHRRTMGGLVARPWGGTALGAPVTVTPDGTLVDYVPLGSRGVVIARADTPPQPVDLAFAARDGATFATPVTLAGGFVLQPANLIPIPFGGLATAPDGSALAYRNDAGAIVLVSFTGATPKATVLGPGTPSGVPQVDFSPDSRWLRYGTATGMVVHDVQGGTADIVLSMTGRTRWSPRGRLAIVSASGTDKEQLAIVDPAKPTAPKVLVTAKNVTLGLPK